jgi:8-oxo-dGTP pyrophosphatase MutT (NUDIX family)
VCEPEGDLTTDARFSEPKPGDQVAAIPWRRGASGVEFCFVKSSSGRRIFPKGKVEQGERPWDSAAREAKEEAGVLGTVVQQPLTTFWYDRPKRGTHEMVTAYLLEVVVSEGLREDGRKPKWWDLERALEKLSKKKQADNSDELKRVLTKAHQAITSSGD